VGAGLHQLARLVADRRDDLCAGNLGHGGVAWYRQDGRLRHPFGLRDLHELVVADQRRLGPWTQIQGGVAAPRTTVYGVSRNTDLIDIFAVGTDHGTYTAAYSPASGWRGWWNVTGGVVAPGTSITAVSRSTDKLDIFVAGTDYGVYTAAWQPGDTEWGGWWNLAHGVIDKP
jgi:hypothetical protein